MDYNVCNVNSVNFGCNGNIRQVPKAVNTTCKSFREKLNNIDNHALDSGITKLYLIMVELPERLKQAIKNCFKK